MKSLRLALIHFKSLCERVERIAAVNDVRVITDFMEKLDTAFETARQLYTEAIEVSDEQTLIDEYSKLCTQHTVNQNKLTDALADGSVTTQKMNESGLAELSVVLAKQTDILHKMADKAGTTQMPTHPFKLQTLSIPPFGGNYSDWGRFRDMYETTIHNNVQLSKIQRFTYLKSLLTDEAAKLVNSIPLSNDAYDVAWDLLKSHYSKPFLIIRSLIDSLHNCDTVSQNFLSFKQFFTKFSEIINILDSMGDYAKSRDPWILFMVVAKFDPHTRRAWSEEICTNDTPTITDLQVFLRERCQSLEIAHSAAKFEKRYNEIVPKNLPKVHTSLVPRACFYCKEAHAIHKCSKFLSLPSASREQFIRTDSRCFNCFGKGHSLKTCVSKLTCLKCKRKHHTLLHKEAVGSSTLSNADKNHEETLETNVVRVNQCFSNSEVLLPTAVVSVQNGFGVHFDVRVLLDSGSQLSLISENLVSRLSLKREQVRVPILCFGNTRGGYSKGKVTLNFSSRVDPAQRFSVGAFVVPQVIQSYPDTSFQVPSELKSRFPLADPGFSISSAVDVILASPVLFESLKNDRFWYKPGNYYLQNTHFGYVACGGTCSVSNSSPLSLCVVSNSLEQSEGSLNEDIERFWRLEEPPVLNSISDSDRECEEGYVKTTKRLANGRFCVRLPFLTQRAVLGDSYHIAVRKYLCLEKRLQSNRELSSHYSEFMKEYLRLGHMRPLSMEPSQLPRDQHFVIPHHCVWQPGKKLRVVFNASSSSSNGVSLNDVLHVGPTLQTNIVSILLNFRRYRYVLIADLIKMYRQIEVHPDDQLFQLIIWREKPCKPLQLFKLSTVTYGVSSAPYLALRVLNDLIERGKSTVPEACGVLTSCRYVDDLLFGADDLVKLAGLRDDVIQLLGSAGFVLHKWCSNESSLLATFPDEQLAIPKPYEFETDSPSVKTLGLSWCPEIDVFIFSPGKPNLERITKRVLLAETARIFDPLGLISPVVVSLKILFQKTWVERIGWDDQLHDQSAKQVRSIFEELNGLTNVRIPRFWGSGVLELHGFADASTAAYAAVIYVRILNSTGTPSVHLLISKTKLAPVKPISVPRLELCAAHLLARLYDSVRLLFGSVSVRNVLWSDSSTVLSWLASLPRRWTLFVANRVSHIQELCPDVTWHHVRSIENPADLASRGVAPSNLLRNDLWWHGPSFLRNENLHLPLNQFTTELDVRRSDKVLAALATPFLVEYASRFSSFDRLVRTVGYMLRMRHRSEMRGIAITLPEFQRANLLIIRAFQQFLFSEDLETLRNAGRLSRKSLLYRLNPYLDDSGLLRVGGRLNNAPFDVNFQHPIILSNCAYVRLLISRVHLINFHASSSLILSNIRNKFWIFNIRRIVESYIHHCPSCIRISGRTFSPQMGDLPSVRFSQVKPFHVSGVDFAGPFSIRPVVGRGKTTVKSYIALFVCLSTRAIHLELIMGLSTVHLIMGLQRFLSRRGRCSQMWSDNATNFIGMSRIFREMRSMIIKEFDTVEIRNFMLKNSIEWHTIPPYSPHFGGIWEAGVRSVKTVLAKSFRNHIFSVEELQTCLCQIEHILNSRPLSPLSDSSPLDPLTPNHFLNSTSDFTIPQFERCKIPDTSLRGRYMLILGVVNGFWRRWRYEYLNSFIRRPKWVPPGNFPKIGDVVLIKRNFNVPALWPLGVVVELMPGNNDQIRVVKVKTNNGEHIESSRNLIPLKVDADASTGGVC